MKIKLRAFCALTILAAAIAPLPASADSYEQTDPVIRLGDGENVGQANSYRTANRVQTIIRTSDLDPGSVVTVWWRIYNRPQHCAIPFACSVSDLGNPDVDGSQLHANAHVVSDPSGSAMITSSIYRTAKKAQGGDNLADTLVEGHLKGRGLRRPLNADVELVLVSHGRKADPVMDGAAAADAQLLTPGGTSLDCADPNTPTVARSFRCGALQIVNVPPQPGAAE